MVKEGLARPMKKGRRAAAPEFSVEYAPATTLNTQRESRKRRSAFHTTRAPSRHSDVVELSTQLSTVGRPHWRRHSCEGRNRRRERARAERVIDCFQRHGPVWKGARRHEGKC